MPRLLPTVLVVCLLAGTAAAFAVTESRKLEAPPLTGTRVDKVFAPLCGCPKRLARIRFRLTHRNRLEVAILRDGDVVRTLEPGMLYGPGPKHFEWNGRDGAGRVVADGTYEPRVTVGGHVISLPNPIRVDTVKPRIAVTGVAAGRSVRIRYRVSEPAHALLFVGARRVVYTRFQRPTGTLVYAWHGGALSVAAEDTAGNVGPRVPVRLPE